MLEWFKIVLRDFIWSFWVGCCKFGLIFSKCLGFSLCFMGMFVDLFIVISFVGLVGVLD